MQNDRILIFGRNGQVGWELCQKLTGLGDVIAVGHSEADFTRPESLRKVVREVAPRAIVNAVAYTAVDKAETEPELATAINATGPGVLAEEAARLGSLLVHYSTDYVFDGTKPKPWVETDTPNPLSVYGKTKLAGDQAIQSSGCEYLIFRTTWVYGARGSNFLLTMLRLAKERPELRIVDDQIGAPTSSESIAEATASVLAQVLAHGSNGIKGRSGIYNMTNRGETSWFGFARSILTRASSDFGMPVPNLIPIPTREYPTPAERPLNSRLCCQKIEDAFGVKLPHWEDALARVFEKLEY
jgi:dTDP-4-dehydrorhamnose reductase